ncbi:MAG: PD40 domain-containing protein [Acidobacteria bacterium]|nr:PD40 domain-containing protein [Acidobacteriota bacterium]
MKRNLLALIVAGGCLLLAQNAEVLLQRGVQKETVDGDLKGAIELYKRAARQAGGNRGTAAKAMLKLAECYEKQGNQEARKTYEQIVRDYGDQAEASIAQSRLGGRPGARQVQARKLFDGPYMGNMGTPSPDGRYLAFIHWVTGNAALFDTMTRETKLVTTEASWLDYKGFPGRLVFSPDGKQLAYWWNDAPGQLRIQPVSGGSPRVLLESKNDWLSVIDWLPGGTHLLAARDRSKKRMLTLISVSDGSVKELGVTDVDPYNSRLSPDGKYLALTRKDKADGDITVLPLLNGIPNGPESPLVSYPADETFLGWAPAGDYVLFSSNRSGSIQAYLVPFKDGRATGEAVRVQGNLGRVSSAGFDRSGKFYYHPSDTGGSYDVHIADLDVASGKQKAAPVKIPAALTGTHREPRFSPDGKQLVYHRGREARTEIVLFDFATSAEKVVSTGSQPFVMGVHWLPDGRAVARTGEKYLVVDWGQQKLIDLPIAFQDVPPGSTNSCKAGVWMQRKDQEYRLLSLVEGKRWVVRKEVNTPQSEPAFDVSPDCRQLAWADNKRSTLLVGPAAGGEPRVLVQLPAGERIDRRLPSVRWTPDGRYIFFKKVKSWDKPLEIWRVPAAGGEPVFTGITGDWMEYLTVNEDGSRLAWAGGRHNYEGWVMENILPR